MKLTKKQAQTISISLLLIGAILIMNSLGIIDFEDFKMATASVTTRRGKVGISTTSTAGSIQSGAPLSTVSKGQTYRWKVKMTNTGTLAWDNSRYTLRISKAKANPNIGWIGTTLISEPEVLGKKTMVLTGTYKGQRLTDDKRLRDEICREWNLAYKVGKGGSWTPVSCAGTRVECLRFGSMKAGESKTIYFKMDVPKTTYGKKTTRYLVGNGVAVVGDTYVISHNKDKLTVGTVEGNSTLKMITGAIAIGAALLLSRKFLVK